MHDIEKKLRVSEIKPSLNKNDIEIEFLNHFKLHHNSWNMDHRIHKSRLNKMQIVHRLVMVC